jgi:hypothetical protein
MRRPIYTIIVAGLLMAGGCATQSGPAAPSVVPQPLVGDYQEAASSALVFDPPIAAFERPVELARGPRQPSAFMGYEEPSATYYDIQTFDHQANDGTAYYQRDTIMDKVGVSYR